MKYTLIETNPKVYTLTEHASVYPNGAPTGLAAVIASLSQINLTWHNGSTDENNIYVYRSTDAINYTLIISLASGTEAYSDTVPSIGTYYYKVVAVKVGGHFSAYSNVVTVDNIESGAVARLDFSILEDDGSYYFLDTISGKQFPITGYDFDDNWTTGFPYKSAATLSAPAGDAALIAADINHYFYAVDGTPNQIPVISLFQDIDYEHRVFFRHVAQVLDANGVETYEPRVIEMLWYAAPATGDDITLLQTYFSAPAESATAKWVSATGNDTTGTGTKALPWLTLAKATATVNDGSYIYVKSSITLASGRLTDALSNKIRALGFVRITPSDSTYSIDLRVGLTELTGIYDAPSANATYHIYGNGSSSLDIDKLYIVARNSIIFGAFKSLKNSVITGGTLGNYGLRPSGAMALVTIENNYINVINSVNVIWQFNAINAITFSNNKLKTSSTNLIDLTSATFTALIFKGNYCHGIVNFNNAGTVDVSYNTFNEHAVAIARSNDTNVVVFKNNRIEETSVTIESRADIENNINYSPTLTATGYTGIQKTTATPVTGWHFKRNILYKNQSAGFILLVGYDSTSLGNGQITDIVIEQNKITNTITSAITTHSIFIGYQINAEIKHNKIDVGNGYAIVIEGAAGLAYTSGGIFGNIIKSGRTGIVDGGMDGLNVFNNLFILSGNSLEWGVAFFDHGGTPPHPSNCKCKNNIFILTGTGDIIAVENYHATNEIDYNLYYCPNGNLRFKDSVGTKTFAQWQAAGYDTHSVVLSTAQFNALFTDYANEDYSLPTGSLAIGFGTNVGAAYDDGLDATTVWGATQILPSVVTKQQGAAWDCGAYVH